MAADYYLQLDGIKGESTDSKHQGWVECTMVHWEIKQPKSATASTGGGHTAQRAELSEFRRRFPDGDLGPQVLQGEVEVYPTEDRGRQCR
jgi:hypothetical protein